MKSSVWHLTQSCHNQQNVIIKLTLTIWQYLNYSYCWRSFVFGSQSYRRYRMVFTWNIARCCSLKDSVKNIYFLLYFYSLYLTVLLHSMAMCSLVSTDSLTIRFHSGRSFTMMLSVCPSAWHHSLKSSIHSLHFLSCFAPPRFRSPHYSPTGCHPSYPNNFSFLSMIICTTVILMSSLRLISKFFIYFLLPVYVENSSVAFHFSCHQRVSVSLPQGPGLTCI